jgi:hypothetical protein
VWMYKDSKPRLSITLPLLVFLTKEKSNQVKKFRK